MVTFSHVSDGQLKLFSRWPIPSNFYVGGGQFQPVSNGQLQPFSKSSVAVISRWSVLTVSQVVSSTYFPKWFVSSIFQVVCYSLCQNCQRQPFFNWSLTIDSHNFPSGQFQPFSKCSVTAILYMVTSSHLSVVIQLFSWLIPVRVHL